MQTSLSQVLLGGRGSPPVSTRDENRTGTFMRQMRGENMGPKYRSHHVCGYSVRDKLEAEAGFMLHVARDKGSRARWKSEAPRATIREATDESCKWPGAPWYPRTSGTQVSINLYVAVGDTRESSMRVHRDAVRGFRYHRNYTVITRIMG